MIAKILEQYTILHAKTIKLGNAYLAEYIKQVFDCSCTLHQYNYEDENVEMRMKERKKAEEWRHKLKVGDRIDAVKGDLKCKSWC